jgi:type III pantothenate kinase
MNLCIDIGNTRYKAGFFSKHQLVDVFESHAEIELETIMKWNNQYSFSRIIISSVRILNEGLIKALSDQFDVTVVSTSMNLPIEISYETPETLGVDRVLGAIGAQNIFPSKNTLSIDAGTCITYDLVVDGIFIGGAISPGVQMRLDAMHKFTDKLPNLKKNDQIVTFGTSTTSSMLMGAESGAIEEMKGFIRTFSDQIENLKVILTGGDASFFEGHVENATFAAPNLVLIGLNKVLLET